MLSCFVLQETVKSNSADNVQLITEQQCIFSALEAFLITSTLPLSFTPHIETSPGKHIPLVTILVALYFAEQHVE